VNLTDRIKRYKMYFLLLSICAAATVVRAVWLSVVIDAVYGRGAVDCCHRCILWQICS